MDNHIRHLQVFPLLRFHLKRPNNSKLSYPKGEKSELKFKGLLESAPDAMIITDKKGEIKMVNAQTEVIFGYNRDEVIGQKIEMLIPGRFREKHVSHIQNYVEAPKVRGMGVGMSLFGLRNDGSEFPVEVSLSPLVLDKEEIYVISAIRDITRQKESENQIKKLNENLEQLVSERTKKLEDALNSERIIREEMIRNQLRLSLSD
ncbi:MAG: PAS domain S-box protein [Bacteroidales bacterium]|nr:PAS domain S-box protein [Bacteroidales bacterium]